MDFLRYCFGILVCCLLTGYSGYVAAQPYPSQQIHRTLSAALQQPPPRISTVPQKTPPLRIAPSQQSHAGLELHQPWNLSEFPVRTNNSLSPYRLVSDTQPAEKTPPPVGNVQQLLPSQTAPAQTAQVQTVPSQVASQTIVNPTSRTLPILNVGRAFLNEFRPSNERKWSQNHAVTQTAVMSGNLVTIRNIRYSRYESADSYTTQYYDATFNLDDIRTIDLVMVPFQGLSRLAHVESSFGFADGRQVGMSIEARYEEGEKYDPAAASLRQFELMYLFADERDMIRLATDVNKNDVFVYRLTFEPNEVRTMFVDALQRANKLAAQPEFYHPLTNSCITNLIAHINKGRVNAVPREYRTLMPGLFDNYLYDLKLVKTTAKTYKEARDTAKVNWLVERYGDLEYFSAGIRQNMY